MAGFPTIGRCPCGSGSAYDDCCGPLHRQERQAENPEALMRSRYAAYAVGDADHLFRTWHPRTRPDDLSLDPALVWTSLEILSVEEGTEDNPDVGFVAFRAHWSAGGRTSVLAERSRFVRRAGRWVYLDGEVS